MPENTGVGDQQYLSVNHLTSGIVKDISFSIGAGEVLLAMGPSGSGKSCLLKGIVDLMPNQGDIRLGKMERNATTASQWRRQIQYVPAESRWWYPTAAEHFKKLPDSKSLAAFYLEKADLEKPITHLSTGQKQRLSLLRSIQLQPRALLLDEPTASLDDDTTAAVETYLTEYVRAKKVACLWVTHSKDQASRIGQKMLRLPEQVLSSIL